MSIIIDIGCGAHKQPGTVGIDCRALHGVNVVCDAGELDENKFSWFVWDEECDMLVAVIAQHVK